VTKTDVKKSLDTVSVKRALPMLKPAYISFEEINYRAHICSICQRSLGTFLQNIFLYEKYK